MHEGGVKVQVLDDGALRFRNTHGKRFEAQAPAWGDTHSLALQHQHIGLKIDARSAITRWCGEAVDYGMAIGGLLAQQERQWHVSAETCCPEYPRDC